MEPPARPPPAPPLDPGPRWDEAGPEADPEPEPESELEAEPGAEPALWAAEPAAGTPPWAPPGRGGCPEDEPRLRPVFDALDRDGDGFVRVEEFVQFATAYGAEQVRTEPKPTRRGRSEGRVPPRRPRTSGCRTTPAAPAGLSGRRRRPSLHGAVGASLGFVPSRRRPRTALPASLGCRLACLPALPSAVLSFSSSSSTSSLPRSRYEMRCNLKPSAVTQNGEGRRSCRGWVRALGAACGYCVGRERSSAPGPRVRSEELCSHSGLYRCALFQRHDKANYHV